MILAVHLENIKSYERGEIEFAPGTNAICGPNGAGKSTLIEAIGFALFGSQRVKQEQLIRNDCAHGRIEVRFISSLDELPYTVIRELRREGASTARMHGDAHGLTVAVGVRDVQAELLQHLGIKAGVRPSSLFEGVVGVPQGQLTSDFLLSPGPRKARFEELLALQEFEVAFQRLSRPLAWGRDRVSVTRGKLEALSERIRDSRGARDEFVSVQERLGDARRQLSLLELELADVRRARESLDQQEQAAREAHERLVAARAAYQLAVQRRDEADRRRREAQEAAELAEQARAGHDQYIELEAQVRLLEQQRAQRDRLREELSAVEKTVARLEAEHRALTDRLERVARAETAAEALRPAAARQTQLESQLTDIRLRLAMREEVAIRLAGVEQKLADIARQIEALADRQQALSATPEQLQAAQARLQELNSQFAAVSAEASLLAAKVETQRRAAEAVRRGETKACPACLRPFDRHDAAGFLEQLETQLQQEDKTLAQLHREVDRLRQERRAQQQTVETAQKQTDQLRRAEAELRAKREEQVRTRQESEELAARLALLSELDLEATRIAEDLKSLGDPRARLTSAETLVAEKEELQQAYSRVQAEAAAAMEAATRLGAQLASHGSLDECLSAAAAARDGHREAFDTYRRVSTLAEELPARLRQYQSQVEALRRAQDDLECAQATSERLGQAYDRQAHQEARAREHQLEVELAQSTSLVAELERRLAEADRRVRELEKLEEQRDSLQRQVDRDSKGVETLSFLRETIRRTGPEIARLVLARVSQSASATYAELMGDYASVLAWDDEYGISVRRAAETREFAQLSGGEQMAAALAVRLALLREISDVRIAFFDEPTVNLDEERRHSLAEQIRSIRDLDQLFIISHDDSLESVTENVIRVRKENGLSRLERG